MDTSSKQSFSCLIAGARSQSGAITAVQITFLNPETADIPVAKRSFGVVKGAAVTLQEDKSSNILFIAEGVETALSLKSAGIQGTIKASLGLSNIKRILPESPQAQIVVCADHDAPDSPAAKSLEKSIISLQEQGLTVTVIKPDTLNHDFNDVLKIHGPQGVRNVLEKGLPKDLIATLLPEKRYSLEASIPVENALEKESTTKSTVTPPQKSDEKTINLAEDSSGNLLSSQNSLSDNSLTRGRSITNSASKKGPTIFDVITQQCAQKLYDYSGKNKIDLNSALIKRIDAQATRAANFFFSCPYMKGTQATEKETDHFLLRAKYELDRIPEIRDELIHQWKTLNSYKCEKDELIAHMIAERQASVEGRLYWQAKQRGLIPPLNIADLAKDEIKKNKAAIPALVQELATKQRLSQNAAHFCAKDITCYVEVHGQKPTAEQISAMAHISRDLDKRGYPTSLGAHNIEYLRKQDGDLQFRTWATANKDLSGFKEFPHAVQDYSHSQGFVKAEPQENTLNLQKDHPKSYERDFSM